MSNEPTAPALPEDRELMYRQRIAELEDQVKELTLPEGMTWGEILDAAQVSVRMERLRARITELDSQLAEANQEIEMEKDLMAMVKQGERRIEDLEGRLLEAKVRIKELQEDKTYLSRAKQHWFTAAVDFERQLGEALEREKKLLNVTVPLLREPAKKLILTDCYCQPGRCSAPTIMGRQAPCINPSKANQSAKHGCDCHKHERQVCDVCQGVTGRDALKPSSNDAQAMPQGKLSDK